jgi:hypothetical protein
MTSTSVVLGIATLGTPGATADCDGATDATGSIAMRKGIMNFIGLSSRFSLDAARKEYDRTLMAQKITLQQRSL